MASDDYPNEYQAGRYARQAQRDENRCPFYEMGDEGRRRREAWRKGWRDEDGVIRVGECKAKGR